MSQKYLYSYKEIDTSNKNMIQHHYHYDMYLFIFGSILQKNILLDVEISYVTTNACTGLNHQNICTRLIENCKDFLIPRKQTEK